MIWCLGKMETGSSFNKEKNSELDEDDDHTHVYDVMMIEIVNMIIFIAPVTAAYVVMYV